MIPLAKNLWFKKKPSPYRTQKLSYSMKSSTTPWEPVTLFLGFMLMLAKNPFRTNQKHPFVLSVPNFIIQIQKTKKL